MCTLYMYMGSVMNDWILKFVHLRKMNLKIKYKAECTLT